MKAKCKKCGVNCEGEYCFRHKSRKPLPAKKVKLSGIARELYEEAQSRRTVMMEFFLDIWKERPHKSEVSGTYLGSEPLSIFFHHILPKEKYPQACFDEENIILLTLEEHEQVEMDIYRYEEVNNKRNYLKNKYNL